jgi:hypothetical protein
MFFKKDDCDAIAITNIQYRYRCGNNERYNVSFSITFQKYTNNIHTPPPIAWNSGVPIAGYKYNLEMAALHELGHAHLLLHVNQTDDLMYYVPTQSSSVLLKPTNDNIKAGKHIMGINVSPTSSGCLAQPMIIYNSTDCRNVATNPIQEIQ